MRLLIFAAALAFCETATAQLPPSWSQHTPPGWSTPYDNKPLPAGWGRSLFDGRPMKLGPGTNAFWSGVVTTPRPNYYMAPAGAPWVTPPPMHPSGGFF